MSALRHPITFLFLLIAVVALAQPVKADISFQDAFSKHTAIMLLIDPRSGKIVDANEAASRFYGYPLATLRGMSIQQINTLTADQVARERKMAQQEGRNYFIFRHQVADGSIRTVEAYSVPVVREGSTLLFSVISDISDSRARDEDLWHYQTSLEEMVAIKTAELREQSQLVIVIMGASIAVLVILLLLLITANKRSTASKERAEEKEATLNTIIDNITDAIIYTDRDRNIVTVNESAEKIFGYNESEFQGESAAILYADIEDFREQGTFRFSVDAEPHTDLYEIPYKRKDGSSFVGETLGSVIKNPAGQALGFIGVIRDITKRKVIEEDLRRAASVFRHASEGIVITSPNGEVLDVNSAFTAITGYTRDEVLGKTPQILKSGFQDDAFYKSMWQRLLQKGHWEGEIHNRHKDGHIYIEQLSINAVMDDQDQVLCYVGLFYDITTQKEHEKQLHHIAHYDALTELPNRLLLADRLQQGMLHADRQGDHLAVVYIDLDGFKEINDQFGHDVGDQLLVEIAQRMKLVLREGDTIARLGGDEFVAVFTDLPDTDTCLPLLDRILTSISDGVQIDGDMFSVTASLGVVFYPTGETEPDKLLRQADQSMYQAKLQSKNCYHIFDPVHDRSLKGRHERIERMQQALANQEFVLFYQPKVNMRTGELKGVEALIRWQHPEKGLLPPVDFLPDIANHELDMALGRWVINSALSQMAEWKAKGLDIGVSVNISAQQLLEESFAEQLAELVAAYPTVNPERFELEILESSALQDLQHASQAIKICSQIGPRFALDDFGTGYSSLTYLKSLPVDVLKIDRTFVNGMLSNPEDMAIIKGVLGLATAFQHKLVAEGVETAEQGVSLLLQGCEVAQGYYIAKPMPAAELNKWADSWRPPVEWLNA